MIRKILGVLYWFIAGIIVVRILKPPSTLKVDLPGFVGGLVFRLALELRERLGL